MKKIGIVISIIVIIIIGFIFFLPNDDTKIKATVKKGKEAVEEEDLSKIMSIFSIEYRDRYGLPYGSIKGGFNDLFSRFDTIQVRYTIGDITIKDDTSRVLMDVWAAGIATGIKQDIVGDKHEAGRLELILRKKYTRWLIVSSEWKNPHVLKGIGSMSFLPLK